MSLDNKTSPSASPSQLPSQSPSDSANGNADTDQKTPSTTHSSEYLLLVEFVHKHIDFHDAELLSILEMNGIKVGSDCHFRPLPNEPDETSCNPNSSLTTDYKRPFRILSFPWNTIGSKFAVYEEDAEAETSTGTEGTKKQKVMNLVSALARCTLIRSVIELWGAGPSIDDCVKNIQNGNVSQRHKEGSHLYSPNSAKKGEDRTWKITIHTLGSTYTREEQDIMRSNFAFLNFTGNVQMDNPDDEFLYIREVELDAQGGAVFPRHRTGKEDLIAENDARPPLGCYFGRVLGNARLGRNWRGSNRLYQYSLKKRAYLGPTSME